MPKANLVKEDQGRLFSHETSILDNPHYLSLIAHPLRMRMLKILGDKPLYPAQIAARLQIPEQTIYYHIQKLHKAGILEVAETKEIRGTVAKKFRPSISAFSFVLNEEWKTFEGRISSPDEEKVLSFFSPILADGQFHGSFVVGSPAPHGPLQASARDGHYAIDLALFLGRYTSVPNDFSVKLDVDVKSSKELPSHQILIGGPITNLIMDEFNDYLPVRFTKDAPHILESLKTGKKFSEDSVGFIVKIPHPYDKQKVVIVIAGIRVVGTKSAVLALTRFHQSILKTYDSYYPWAVVVKGVDLDGDGKIDSIEILE